MDEQLIKIELLMEAAQAQESTAHALMERLRDHIEGLDAVTRDAIRRTLIEELASLLGEAARARQALRNLGRLGLGRHALWTAAASLACACVAIFALRLWMPSPAEVEKLRAQRDALKASIAQLQRQGVAIHMKHCGEPPRPCVHIDRGAPVFGAKSDYYVLADR